MQAQPNTFKGYKRMLITYFEYQTLRLSELKEAKIQI